MWGKPTVTDQTFVDTKKFTIKKNSINGKNMGSNFLEEINPMRNNSSLNNWDSQMENNQENNK